MSIETKKSPQRKPATTDSFDPESERETRSLNLILANPITEIKTSPTDYKTSQVRRGDMKVLYAPKPYYFPTLKVIEEELGETAAKTFGLIYQTYIDYEDEKNYIELRQKRLQDGLNRCYSTIRKHIIRLEKAGYIISEHRPEKHITRYYFPKSGFEKFKDEYLKFTRWLGRQNRALDELDQKQNYLETERENHEDTNR